MPTSAIGSALTPSEPVTSRRSTSTRWIAVAAVVLTGLRLPLGPAGLVPGILVAVVLIPVWVPALRAYRGARLVLSLGVLAAASGLWLTAWSAQDHRVDSVLAQGTTLLLIGILGGAGVLLWAREVMPDSRVGMWLGVGMLAGAVTNHGSWGTNPWKFALAVPIAVLALSAVRTRGRLVELGVLVLLGLASAAQDSRSAFGIFLVAGTLVLWQQVPVRAAGQRVTWRQGAQTLLVVAATAGAIYNLGTALVLDGHLGESAQQRSVAQIETSGSLLLGGRPELAATIALMVERPAGFGAGTLPTVTDINVAKSGMAAINYEPDNGYVERFMFGTQVRLHSVIGEVWAAFGIPGAALALVVVVLAVAALGTSVAGRTASGLAIWLTFVTMWNMFFGPLYGSAPALIATLGLALLRRDVTAAAGSARTPRT